MNTGKTRVKTAKKTAKTRAKRKASEPKKLPVKQRDYQVGDKKPPKEHQFKPGESGNPNGPPKHRTQLWTYFCKYMSLTDTELAKLDRSKLTQAQQTALKLVQNAKAGKYSGSERLARYVRDYPGQTNVKDPCCEYLCHIRRLPAPNVTASFQ
ncbi:MAG: DUF5681 domain-containing protein [Planctomycetota bacterium]|jgi:hypothetical protein